MLKVGLILYSVRDMMAQDPLGTVDAVAKLGYKSIEVCNHNALQDSGCGFGIPASDLKAKLDAYGSRVISAHVEPLLQADLDQVIAYEQILGNRNIVFPMGGCTRRACGFSTTTTTMSSAPTRARPSWTSSLRTRIRIT